jgi:hypothetical protein
MPRRSITLLPLLLLSLASPAVAGELAGITLDDTVSDRGVTLQLVGMGLRSKLGIKAYVLGLYMERPTTDEEQVVSSRQVKRADMAVLLPLGGEIIGKFVVSGFRKTCSDTEYAALEERLDSLLTWFPTVGKGDVISMTWVPGAGTIISGQGEVYGTVEGDDFAEALFGVWFGSNAVDDRLKAGVLED